MIFTNLSIVLPLRILPGISPPYKSSDEKSTYYKCLSNMYESVQLYNMISIV